jgi:hypothetical protein
MLESSERMHILKTTSDLATLAAGASTVDLDPHLQSKLRDGASLDRLARSNMLVLGFRDSLSMLRT